MYGLTFWGTIEYVHNYWYAIPIGLGSWLGTYITVREENIKQNIINGKQKRRKSRQGKPCRKAVE